jgi:outer membrane protein OmpU
MKKILLASTILVGTAGFAAADNANFTFSGSAYAGMAYVTGDETVSGIDWNDDGDTLDTSSSYIVPEVTASFTAGMMTTTDMGLEAGASITLDAKGISVEDDNTDDTPGTGYAFGRYSQDDDGAFSNASVYLSGDFGKLEVVYDNDGSNGTVNTDWDVNFKYSNTWGDFGVSAYYTVAVDKVGATNGDMGIKGTYNFGDYSVFAEFEWDESDGVGGDWNATVGGSASMSGFGLNAEANYNNFANDWDWKASASYSTGAYTIGAFVEEDDGIDTDFDFGANGSYDLGGGVSVDAAYIYDNDGDTALAKLGVSMAF